VELLPHVIIGIVVIAASTVLARRLSIAGPLVLVAIGLVASLFLPKFSVDPELILAGVLPPLLFAAAVRLPAIEFRRDARPIAGLAVLLVVISSLVLGAFFFVMIPALDFALAVALGAILSPTDAVATSIVKKLGISPRVVTMLEGESLLNDATALVLLRSAVAAVAAGFSFWGTVGTFAWGVLVAIVVGVVIGLLALRVRKWLANSAASTAIGFVVPFAAYVPTEHFGGSGLVAAVVAGITVGQGAVRWFTAEERISDQLNWRTIEFLLEGAVFLIMGLELRDLVSANVEKHNGVGVAFGLALAALGIVLVVRAAYVAALVALQSRRIRNDSLRERLEAISDRLDAFDPSAPPTPRRPRPSRFRAKAARRLARDPGAAQRRVEGVRERIRRSLRDLDYYQSSPLGWKHGTIIVWSGMRGVVTLAAAQTLPQETPQRELLIFTAFLVALISLLLQGLTLPWVIRALRIPPAAQTTDAAAELARLRGELRDAALQRLQKPGLADADGEPFDPHLLHGVGARMAEPPSDDAALAASTMRELRLVLIDAMRQRLAELSREGSYASETLRHALAELDADQMSLEIRREDAGGESS
jgi:CPA1 family monovalent cation:H+ antiporter